MTPMVMVSVMSSKYWVVQTSQPVTSVNPLLKRMAAVSYQDLFVMMATSSPRTTSSNWTALATDTDAPILVPATFQLTHSMTETFVISKAASAAPTTLLATSLHHRASMTERAFMLETAATTGKHPLTTTLYNLTVNVKGNTSVDVLTT